MRWMYTTNKSMQRYTAHAASAGSLLETHMHCDAMLRTAKELRMEVPALEGLGKYFEAKQCRINERKLSYLLTESICQVQHPRSGIASGLEADRRQSI
jgi:hypothetical protein